MVLCVVATIDFPGSMWNLAQSLVFEVLSVSIAREGNSNGSFLQLCDSSLACGHLFGKECIKRWLKLAGKKQGKVCLAHLSLESIMQMSCSV